jgi:hypothetical protein
MRLINPYNFGAGITFVGSATRNTSGNITLPTLQEGDMVLLILVVDSGDFATPAGYTQVNEATGGLPSYHVSYKFMTSTPDTTAPVADDTVNNESGIAYCFRGVNQTTPLDVAVTTSSGSGSTSPNPPSITPVSPNAAIVALGFLDDSIITAATPPTGYGDVVFVATGGGAAATASASGMVSWKKLATPAADDPAAYSTTGGAADDWLGLTIALRPA